MNMTLTRLVIACLGLAACATAGSADALTLSLGAQSGNGTATGIPITLTNGGARPHREVAVTCSFFDAGGAPITVSRAYLPALAPGATVTETFIIPGSIAAVARHECRVD